NRDFRDSARIAVTLPLPEIVSRLNRRRPRMLSGYASAIARLAAEAEAGRLQIEPDAIYVTSEPLLPEMATRIERAFGVTPTNVYGTADAGVVAIGCGEGDGMHLNEDAVIVEPVDAEGRPTRPGESAAKILVTVLFQHALPLIRYELTDEVEYLDEPCPCGSSFRRIRNIEGRLDDTFVYGPRVVVHPHVFRSRLARAAEIREYQVEQTPRVARIRVVAQPDLDERQLARSLEADLARLGLSTPTVGIDRVDAIPRQGQGKLERFVTCPGPTDLDSVA
ncbi:MAG TPA: phenylacetate--CoA ligase family protein, partial [Myxococcota bacterium]|nr:phenylacetate--CoA ligase family protein [Myxococcota bacterium]